MAIEKQNYKHMKTAITNRRTLLHLRIQSFAGFDVFKVG